MTALEYDLELCGKPLAEQTEQEALDGLIASHRRLRAECIELRTEARWAARKPRYRDVVETLASDLVASADGGSVRKLFNEFMERLGEDIVREIYRILGTGGHS